MGGGERTRNTQKSAREKRMTGQNAYGENGASFLQESGPRNQTGSLRNPPNACFSKENGGSAKMPSGQGDPFGGGDGLQSPKFAPFCRKSGAWNPGKSSHFWTKTAKNAQKNSGPQNRLYRYIYIYMALDRFAAYILA